MIIELCIHCWNYQRRLNWMLSSLNQQVGDKPDLLINIAYSPNNGNPSTESVIDFFRKKGLKIKETVLNETQMCNRAIGRNLQVRNTSADYLLFADSDHVYSQDFFADLKKTLTYDLQDCNLVMGADRISLDIEFCQNYFKNDMRTYPCEVDFVEYLVQKWPVKRTGGRHVCAGNFQLAKVEAIRAKGGVYCFQEKDLWRATKGDRQFRIGMGGRLGIETKKQYHLNHNRDLGVQR